MSSLPVPAAALHDSPLLKSLGRVPYEPVWQAMRDFNASRTTATRDEIWFLEHEPVFTQGLNGHKEHVLAPGDIPVVETDRGGQVTYHGPGQLVVYPLLDLERWSLSVRDLVLWLENATIAAVAEWGIAAAGRRDAPGVYVEGAKLASLGLRIKRGGSYHGLALNVDADLEPFGRINPCGYAGLKVTRIVDLGGPSDIGEVARTLSRHLLAGLGLPPTGITGPVPTGRSAPSRTT